MAHLFPLNLTPHILSNEGNVAEVSLQEFRVQVQKEGATLALLAEELTCGVLGCQVGRPIFLRLPCWEEARATRRGHTEEADSAGPAPSVPQPSARLSILPAQAPGTAEQRQAVRSQFWPGAHGGNRMAVVHPRLGWPILQPQSRNTALPFPSR